MPLAINLPTEKSWNKSNVSLGGVDYEMTVRYNSRDKRWRLDIYRNDVLIVGGLKIVENNFLLRQYGFDDFAHGDLILVRLEKDETPAGRDNVGSGKSYSLFYYSNAELDELA